MVANLTMFPLLFVSGVFYSSRRRPMGTADRRLFPLSHVVEAFRRASARTRREAVSREATLVVLVWGAAGAFVAVRRFAREATDEDGASPALALATDSATLCAVTCPVVS